LSITCVSIREHRMKTPEHQSWNPTSWQTRPAQQQPVYRDPVALADAVAKLSRLPPIVVSWEVERLCEELAAAQRGERFLLQGGDCAESFEDCESDKIAKRLKILLQMSLVLDARPGKSPSSGSDAWPGSTRSRVRPIPRPAMA
jgi:3-deoxy-D-arabino-heptulosonate 7-phosphate (DAHP) synthase class II